MEHMVPKQIMWLGLLYLVYLKMFGLLSFAKNEKQNQYQKCPISAISVYKECKQNWKKKQKKQSRLVPTTFPALWVSYR